MRLIIRPEAPLLPYAVEVGETAGVGELMRKVEAGQRLTCFLRGVRVLLCPQFSLPFYRLQEGDSIFSESISSLKGSEKDRGSAVDGVYLTRLMRQVQKGSLESFQKVLTEYFLEATACSVEEDDQLIDKFSGGCWNCVHYASYFGRPDFLSYLLELGADINKESLDGWTPLQLAAWKGHLECKD